VKYCDEYVCLSMCLSVREDISRTVHVIFTKFFVHVADGRGSVLLLQGDEIPRGRGNFGFALTMHCTVFAAKGIIQYQAEGGDGSAQCRRSVIYDCLVWHL